MVVGLIIALILGSALASYLILVSQQHRAMVRSATWGTSLALSEAGVEEALGFINKYAATSKELSTWTNNPESDGWSRSGNVFSKSTTVDSGIGGYTVYVTNLYDADNLPNIPAIYSVGRAVWSLSSAPVAPQYYFAVAGVQGVAGQANVPIVRSVWVKTLKTPLFSVAMAAIGQINLNGNNIRTDSFDASDSNYSINGRYPMGDPSKTKDNGSVVTLSTLINSLSVGNANIKGKVKTGPQGTIAIGNNGSVGSKAWVDGGNKGIQAGYSADDFNIDFPSAVLPNVSWSALPGATSYNIDGISYDRVFFNSGTYVVSSLSGKILIATNAQVTLLVTGNVSLNGSERIDISPENASLTIYMAGSSFSTSGGAGINNLSQMATTFAYFGLPSNTSLNLGGNANFSGTIYAPQADFSLGGGGNNVYDFVGASVTKTVTMNGHYNFHYDESLKKVGPSRGYVPTSWAEK